MSDETIIPFPAGTQAEPVQCFRAIVWGETAFFDDDGRLKKVVRSSEMVMVGSGSRRGLAGKIYRETGEVFPPKPKGTS